MNPLIYILIVIFVIVAILAIVYFTVPAFRNEYKENKKQTRQEIATEEVNNMVVSESSTPKKSSVNKTDEYLDKLEKKENETGIVFTDEELKFILLDFEILGDEL